MRPGDRPAVHSLQAHLEYADQDLVSAAVDGPFIGLVAEGAGSVVGYAVALGGTETTLSELVVAPDHRRAGHGRALVDAVAAATAAEVLVVTTPATAGGAREFYASLGFAVDSRIEGHYADGADALRLVRRE
jgi:ribosomal-protein-alanine N-acetyltransferase